MSDYFDRVEQGLREAAAERRHMPWLRRVALRPRRGFVVVAACLVVSGSALAASGVFQTGAPVAPEVAPVASTNVGTPIASSVRLLSLRVADPDGGPPWGLRTIRTTRGLTCVQVGRIVDGRIGVLGRDGAFYDDGRFHPLAANYLEDGAFNCATEDANGNAFLNEEAFGVPVAGLKGGGGAGSGGCYLPRPSKSCPPADLRNISYGLLGPDATSIVFRQADGPTETMPTVGGDGAYLVVQRHIASGCMRGPSECSSKFAGVVRSRDSSGSTGGPTLNAFGVVRAVSYRGGSTCRLPDEAEVRARENAERVAYRARLHQRYPGLYRKLRDAETHSRGLRLSPRESAELESLAQRAAGSSPENPCPAVGYAPLRTTNFTSAEIATALHVRIESSRFYCEKQGLAVPCGPLAPAGLREIHMQPEDHELLVIVSLRTRIPITNYDRHYEILTSALKPSNNARCPGGVGGGNFGPSDSNYRVGQTVDFTEFIPSECRGSYYVKVGLVSTDGPSGAMPVPGLPGQSAEVPVGETKFNIP